MSNEAEIIVPSWIPSTPDDTMNLVGRLPSDCMDSLEVASTAALHAMKTGQRFFQYFKAPSGAQVRKNILLFYVEDPSGRGAGKLCWSEKSRRSISLNRQLALDKITDIYLGAQTAVLKGATELAAAAATESTSGPNDALLFSLLSDTNMLDLEATSMPHLCYWLWGLGVIMNSHDRAVNEKEAGVGEDLLNTSSRSLMDTSVEVTESEMDSLKRDLMGDSTVPTASSSSSQQQHARRRHTRKFSIAVGGGSGGLNESHHEELSTLTMQALKHSKSTMNPVAPLKNSFTHLKQAVQTELQSMNNFVQASLQGLLQRTQAHASVYDALSDSLQMEQRKRRRLQNKLIELQGNIRVFARVRPLSEKEQAEGSCIDFPMENTLSLIHGGDSSSAAAKQFEFDRVYAPATTQEEVFKDVAPFVQSAVDGYNICVFAYGQTGAGKSYTMEGPSSNPGVNTRALTELFHLTQESSQTRTQGYSYEISLSVVEIYNETLRDLLCIEKSKPKLEIRLGQDGGVYVPELTELKVTSVDQVQELMRSRAMPNRAVAATNMNEHSSRSHCCVFIKVTGTNGVEKTQGRLVLIDLAGSERIAKSGAEGQALKEAQAINTSLSALGNVIAGLQSKKNHVPYRDSKLTHLLSDCLSGQSKVVMFVQLSPVCSSSQETTCSLGFATRARSVDLGIAKKNKTTSGPTQAEVLALKRQMQAQTEQVKDKLKQESSAQIIKVQKQLQSQTESYATLQSSFQQLQSQLKSIEKERDMYRAQANQPAPQAPSMSTQGVTALHNQIRTVEKECASLRTQLQVQSSTHTAAMQAKDRELRELRAKLLMPSPTGKMQAWEAAAGAISASLIAKPRLATMDSDVTMEDSENRSAMANQPQRTPKGAVGGKKRRSGEVDQSQNSVEEGALKKQAIERDDLPVAAAGKRPATAAPSRIAAPLMSLSSLQAQAAAQTAAQTARTRRQQVVAQVSQAVASSTAAGSRTTRARPATAAVTTSLKGEEGNFGFASSIPILSVIPSAVDDAWTDSAPVASSPTSSGTMSVTEAAMAKLHERRLKFKAERAALKKPAATTGWK